MPAIAAAIDAVGTAVSAIFNPVGAHIATLLDTVSTLVGAAIDPFSRCIAALPFTPLSALITALLDAIGTLLTVPVDTVGAALAALVNAIGALFAAALCLLARLRPGDHIAAEAARSLPALLRLRLLLRLRCSARSLCALNLGRGAGSLGSGTAFRTRLGPFKTRALARTGVAINVLSCGGQGKGEGRCQCGERSAGSCKRAKEGLHGKCLQYRQPTTGLL
ncbi:MAG: hypothetical protein O9293_07560 [Porphyrobacter sp.]|nr:hypothetical protein [Porphyrobacter sp.]